MNRLLFTYFFLLFGLVSFGQKDSTKIFESSKGNWALPLPKFIKIYDNENLKRFTANQFDSTLRFITDSSYQVKAVYAGTVVDIIEVEGEYLVITYFGDYFLAYGRLTKPNLLKGQFIKAGHNLGQVVKNWAEENYTLEIMLSKGTNQLSDKKWFAW